MGNRFNILDTFDDFVACWKSALSRPLDVQIHLWQTSYMGKYPELLDMQLKSYADDNADWKEIAGKVVPAFQERMKLMKKARANIIAVNESVYARAAARLKLDFEVTLVVYVGIGCGAGWAAKYNGSPAVLLGLENIAEEKWHTRKKLRGLISHELGHVIHMDWRDEWEKHEENERKDPFFLLYSEGFAQKCEHLIAGKETWHMAPEKDWLFWCEQNKNWLKKEFKTRLENNEPVTDFFGSWYDIRGYKQTGYYLGHAFISELGKSYSLEEIALLDPGAVHELALRWLQS